MALTSVYSKTGAVVKTAHIPSVIKNAPIRPDVVQFVHTQLNKNHRQPYARYNLAGHEHSAESWGTGRAVARVPRISGSGTSRNGQGAFANFARGGHMFNPLKIYRRWHRLVNVSQKRFATCAAIAATSVPALVMARGHKVDSVPEFPLVVADEVEQIKKTKDAVALLKALHADADVQRSADSRKVRTGAGKIRNRRYIQRRGVLIIHDKGEDLPRAFRNISGVDVANVNRLNLLHLAPGGHIGRFVIWTEGAYKKLDALYGTKQRNASLKAGYSHPTGEMTTTDLYRIIHSKEVQSHVKPRFAYPGALFKKHRNIHVPKTPSPRAGLLLTRKIQKHKKLRTAAQKERAKKLQEARTELLKAKKIKKPTGEKKPKKKAKVPKTAEQKKLAEKRKKKIEKRGDIKKVKQEIKDKYLKKKADRKAKEKAAQEANKKKKKEREIAKKKAEGQAKKAAAQKAAAKKEKENAAAKKNAQKKEQKK